MVRFKKNHLTVEKVNLKSSNFVGFLAHRKSSRFEILLSIVRVSINAKMRPEKHFKMEHFSETEICIAKFSFHKKFVYSSVVNWLQFQQSTKNLSSFLRKFFHAFSALWIVLLCIFQWNRIDSNYHPSNAHEVENAPNKNADKSFVNDYQNA